MVLVDFSKAFDMLRWDAINVVLVLMDYDSIIRELIQACVSSTSYLILVEGSPTNIIQSKHGVRQEDPLSPLLFISMLNYLIKLMNKAIDLWED